jgi:predicted ATPase with chaperone activity
MMPKTLEEAGLSEALVEELMMRYLLARGEAMGRAIADQLQLPFRLIEPILNRLKLEQLTAYRGANSVNDYTHTLTDQGRDRARRYSLVTTYFGAAPVQLEDYCKCVKLQSVEGQHPRREQLTEAFNDLLIDKRMLSKLGPAINSGRGMFLYGYPGNGKTSIAERVTAAFGKYIWIPRALLIDGEIMRLYDPMMHERAPKPKSDGIINNSEVDKRWVRIRRPTIVAGGELTMEMLEVQRDRDTNINEAPLQLKSNCGVLLIDDFGRQKMRVDELLNRWIVPLEKRYDYLNMSSGKKTQVPFDQLVIFSTNLQPKDLVDDAFLRRIPYKIEVPNPSEDAFRKLFEIMCPKVGIAHVPEAINYLIEKHYRPTGRPFRNCHPRDLLLQVRNYCLYHAYRLELRPEYIDFAVENYFSIM